MNAIPGDDTSELVGTRMFFGVFASLAVSVTEDADTASIPIAQSPLGFLALLFVRPSIWMLARLSVGFSPRRVFGLDLYFLYIHYESPCKSQTDAKGN